MCFVWFVFGFDFGREVEQVDVCFNSENSPWVVGDVFSDCLPWFCGVIVWLVCLHVGWFIWVNGVVEACVTNGRDRYGVNGSVAREVFRNVVDRDVVSACYNCVAFGCMCVLICVRVMSCVPGSLCFISVVFDYDAVARCCFLRAIAGLE